MILDEYADWESAYLSSILNQDSKWEVKTASLAKEVVSIGRFKTVVDYQLAEVPTDCELLILVGGNSWTIENDLLKRIVQDRLTNGKFTGAICGAVDYLAQNGLLTAFKHTGNAQYLWKNFSKYQNKTEFVEKQAVPDRHLVTTNGTAALEFTQQVLKMIRFKDNQQIDKDIYLSKAGFYQYCNKYGNPFV
ncbi:DJ-1/PfpI family protein [Bombilactobacillus apium]|uniref:DJ-1/PfpI family protein n=1 Tax=Bombilactobacillus apium TaxID=2675299 RepID=UPI001892C698|nr:DJ-1/PfpI family protein [Bombilactobacillus apium]